MSDLRARGSELRRRFDYNDEQLESENSVCCALGD